MLAQRLVGHTAQIHILEGHPHDHRLAMSAAYDGKAFVWDIASGMALNRSARPGLLCVAYFFLHVSEEQWHTILSVFSKILKLLECQKPFT